MFYMQIVMFISVQNFTSYHFVDIVNLDFAFYFTRFSILYLLIFHWFV